jgi:hypothetical protein
LNPHKPLVYNEWSEKQAIGPGGWSSCDRQVIEIQGPILPKDGGLSAHVCADGIEAGTLKHLPVRLAPRAFYAVQHAHRYRSRAVSALLEILRMHVAL